MKLKLKSDGTPKGTAVLTEDGREVENIESVTWVCDSRDKEARLILTVRGVQAEDVSGLALLGLLSGQGGSDGPS